MMMLYKEYKEGGKTDDEVRAKAQAIYNEAVRQGNKYPMIPVAQSILESGWYKSSSGKNNFFGQKATASQNGRNVMTKEEVNGKLVPMQQRFRDYDTVEESIQDHLKKWQPVYNNSGTLDEALSILSPKYATDSQYKDKIKQIIGSIESKGIIGSNSDLSFPTKQPYQFQEFNPVGYYESNASQNVSSLDNTQEMANLAQDKAAEIKSRLDQKEAEKAFMEEMIKASQVSYVKPAEYNTEVVTENEPQQFQRGGQIVKDNRGQWEHEGKITQINSSNITMKPNPETGKPIPFNVLGIDNLGNQQMMVPGKDYKFKGDVVTEYPQFQQGGQLPWYQDGALKDFKLRDERLDNTPVRDTNINLEPKVLAIKSKQRPLDIKIKNERDEALVQKDGVNIKIDTPNTKGAKLVNGAVSEKRDVNASQLKEKYDIKAVQQSLTDLGYDLGKAGVDGILGKKTNAAIALYNQTKTTDRTAPKSLDQQEKEIREKVPERGLHTEVIDFVSGNVDEFIKNPIEKAVGQILPKEFNFNPALETSKLYDNTEGETHPYLLDNKTIQDIRAEKNISFLQISKNKNKGNALIPMNLRQKIVNSVNPQGYKPDISEEGKLEFFERFKDGRTDTEQVKRLPGVKGDRREDIWNMYSGLPQKHDTFTISSFNPGGKDSDSAVTYKNPQDVAQYVKIAATTTDLFKRLQRGEITPETIARDAKSGKKGAEKINKAGFRDPLNVMWNATFGVGFDDAGKPYLSFYDNWDLKGKDDLKATKHLMGAPIDIYDRIPLTPEMIKHLAGVENSKYVADLDETTDETEASDKHNLELIKTLDKDPKFKALYSTLLNDLGKRYKKPMK